MSPKSGVRRTLNRYKKTDAQYKERKEKPNVFIGQRKD